MSLLFLFTLLFYPYLDGGTTTSTRVTYVKKVTFEEVEIFSWTLCIDSSGMFESLDLAKEKLNQ